MVEKIMAMPKDYMEAAKAAATAPAQTAAPTAAPAQASAPQPVAAATAMKTEPKKSLLDDLTSLGDYEL